MIVRTYGRRNRSISRNCSDSGYNEDVSESFRDSLSQESPQDIYSFAFSSQDSSHWDFDSEPFGSNSLQESRQLAILPPRKEVIGGDLEDGGGGFRKSKKARNRKRELEVPKKLKSKAARSISVVPTVTATATLMETQEFGEMMEHVDEVNFALDGLRKGQPARIRRASLLSLLSICATAQQRRLLRTQGMAKTIIDAVLGLSFDDSPSNLAAAALFYILTSDGQDDHLLDSPSCIRFLIKLLKPLASDATKDKGLTIGGKLLALRKDVDILQDTARGLDSTASAILLKVQEILVSCKEMKSSDGNDNGMGKPELSPKWIALLTMEKACLSTISIEDTSGTVRKTGGNFKEKLRELGGLDAVFEVARNCHTIMEEILVTCFCPDDISFLNYTILVVVKFTEEGWLEKSSSSILESKDNADLESLVLLLKCLKIMENATFLSKDNQNHLLEMKGNFNSQGSPRSFTKLIISAIKILSGLSLLKSSSDNSHKDEFYKLSNGTCHAPDISLIVDHKESAVDSNEILSVSSSIRCCNTELTASQKSFNVSQNSQLLPAGRSGFSKSHSESATPSAADTCLLKMRVNSSASGSCSGTSRSSNREMSASNNGSRMSLGLGKRPKVTEDTKFEFLEDSEDPFAFDEDDFELSKWDLLSGKQKESRTRKSIATYREPEDGCQFQPMLSQQESSNGENHCSHEATCSSAVDKEKSNRLAECLLTSVKVLMNLTNDNAVGCQQIAACGGLETLSLLIADHFPLFSSSMPPFSEISENTLSSSVEVDHQNDRHLTDQELDFLVAILGLLVNLVEKDNHNRSRLASARVPFPGFKGLQEEHCRDVIPLLCSIFLANQGAGEVAGEGKLETWDDEAAVLQGEREAEKMIVEAYAALLLAFLSTESRKIRNAIAEYLPDHKLATLVPVLERFVEFHLALNMISPETHSTVLEVIESCRVP